MNVRSPVLSVLVAALLLSGCAAAPQPTAELSGRGQDNLTSQLAQPLESEPERDFKRCVWISYLDLEDVIAADEAVFSGNLERVMDNLESIKTTDIYLQVRAFGEALYASDTFCAASALYADYSEDIEYLARFAEAARERGMRLHAWLNPYRLGDIESEGYSYVAQRLREGDARAVLETEGGSFINPASEAARELIIADIASLCAEYDIDGVQFDDYFYPSADEALDAEGYAAYTARGGTLSLADRRRENVNALIRGVCGAVHESGQGRVFGVSPDASIERCRSVHFADVERWCAEDGFIDYVCPQIYYGYENETRPFGEVVAEWKGVSGERELIIGMSAYKTGIEDSYAGSGALEWRENFDIIARQYADARGDGAIAGAAFFRYGSLFEPDESVAAFANLELYALRRETDKD